MRVFLSTTNKKKCQAHLPIKRQKKKHRDVKLLSCELTFRTKFSRCAPNIRLVRFNCKPCTDFSHVTAAKLVTDNKSWPEYHQIRALRRFDADWTCYFLPLSECLPMISPSLSLFLLYLASSRSHPLCPYIINLLWRFKEVTLCNCAMSAWK